VRLEVLCAVVIAVFISFRCLCSYRHFLSKKSSDLFSRYVRSVVKCLRRFLSTKSFFAKTSPHSRQSGRSPVFTGLIG
jgi:hypothetical protein